MTKKPKDAIELLDADHRPVKALFDEFAQVSSHKGGGARRKALAEQICMELIIHMRLEEEVFYPPVREAIREDDLLDEAEVEHVGAKEQLRVRRQELQAVPEALREDALVSVSA